MNKDLNYIKKLEGRILELEQELKDAKARTFDFEEGNAVAVPDEIRPLFDEAEKLVRSYFADLEIKPHKASIKIQDERYLLVRASSLSIDFFKTIRELYKDTGEEEAFDIAATFLFDIAHAIGLEDALSFHARTGVTEPLEKLSAGPVHFAYSGWAYVDIDPTSTPSPDENFFLKYQHPYSFEADSWIKAGKTSDKPVCIMNAGYSSGWCEESFGIPLTAVEVSCRACGDDSCTFIMAPPAKIEEHLRQFTPSSKYDYHSNLNIPTFFERKRVYEEMEVARLKAEDSDKAKSDFLANMSHEMRTPLNAIRGYINIMLKEGLSSTHQEYLSAINHSSEHLLDIINDILDLSKIEAGQLMIQFKPTSINKIFEECLHTANSLLKAMNKPIQIACSVDKNIPEYIKSDPTRLKQILNNLLSNALKFTIQGKVSFEVSLKKNPNELYFCIEDTGIGIPKSKQESIFNSFGQVDSSSTREFGGTGLGLTITKKLVELMGGDINVESTLGVGSKFSFTIPSEATTKSTLPNQLPTSDYSNLSGKTILIVEDNLVNLKLVELILKKLNYNILKAINGQEALNIYQSDQRNNVDLILMDVQMPVLNGLEATQQIREFEEENQLKAIPIVALTAQAMQGDLERCLASGCNSYLTKPLNIDLLQKTIYEELKDQ